EKARTWLESALSSAEPLGFAWSVLLAFLRVTTRPGILEHPLSVESAIAYVDSWLQQPNVEIVQPDDRHWQILRTLIATAGTAGNLTSDAHLAALALAGGWTLVSTDHDFRRFSGLSVVNPH
ncbi:MAG TPA: TA system VapC family ribonuclease toxin, partial [Thermoanaerobaculia bacterium]|nr:TA system VapC family ribonuclease toxin [Thermoanaerobaculia bacterium]